MDQIVYGNEKKIQNFFAVLVADEMDQSEIWSFHF